MQVNTTCISQKVNGLEGDPLAKVRHPRDSDHDRTNALGFFNPDREDDRMSRVATQAREHRDTQEAHRQYGVRKLLTAEAIAERLDVPKSTIYEAARQNRIGGVVRLGRLLRFDQAKFEAWLEAGGEALPGGWRQEAA